MIDQQYPNFCCFRVMENNVKIFYLMVMQQVNAVRQFSVKKGLLSSGFLQSKYDPELFSYYCENMLHGLYPIHVDDFNYARTDNFQKTILTNFQLSFQIRKAFTNPFTYVGIETNHQNNTIEASQKAFIKSLSFIPLTQERNSQIYHN